MIISNALYVDARGSKYVATVAGKPVVTWAGDIPLPPNEPWGLQFIKVSPDGSQFTGMGHSSGSPTLFTWFFDSKRWISRPTPWGQGVYAPNGSFLDSLPNGYGYFDVFTNAPIPRTITYEYSNGLNEWVKAGRYQFGQGHDVGGVQVFDGSVLRTIDTGKCFYVNGYLENGSYTISYVKSGIGGIILEYTEAELLALPVFTAPVTPPPPPPPPDKDPPMEAPDEFEIVKRVRARFGAFGEDQYGAFLDAVCAELRGHPWGRKRKNDGSLNTDVLAYERTDKQIEYYDILIGDGKGNIQWGPSGPFRPGENGTWVAAGAVVEKPEDPPVDPVDPYVVFYAWVEGELALLRASVAELKDRKDPEYEIKLDCGRTWGHAHDVSGKLVRKP